MDQALIAQKIMEKVNTANSFLNQSEIKPTAQELNGWVCFQGPPPENKTYSPTPNGFKEVHLAWAGFLISDAENLAESYKNKPAEQQHDQAFIDSLNNFCDIYGFEESEIGYNAGVPFYAIWVANDKTLLFDGSERDELINREIADFLSGQGG